MPIYSVTDDRGRTRLVASLADALRQAGGSRLSDEQLQLLPPGVRSRLAEEAGVRTAIAEEFAPFASQAREVWDAAARAHRGRFEVLRASLRRLEADHEHYRTATEDAAQLVTHPAVATMSDADFRRAARLSASRHGFDWQAYRDHFEWHVEATGSHPRSAAAVVAEMVRDTVAFHNEEQIGQVRDRASLERLRDWATVLLDTAEAFGLDVDDLIRESAG